MFLMLIEKDFLIAVVFEKSEGEHIYFVCTHVCGQIEVCVPVKISKSFAFSFRSV